MKIYLDIATDAHGAHSGKAPAKSQRTGMVPSIEVVSPLFTRISGVIKVSAQPADQGNQYLNLSAAIREVSYAPGHADKGRQGQ